MRLRRISSIVSTRANKFLYCVLIVLAIFGASAAVTQQTPKILILEPDDLVTVRGQVGNDGDFRRTFYIKLDGVDSAKVRFLSSDLVNASGHVIDRRQVSVTGDLQLTRDPRDFLVTVTGVVVAGEYSGVIQIIPENAPQGAAQLHVKLQARPNISVRPVQETTSFAVKLATPSDWLSCFVLGASLCQRDHTVFLRVEGGELPALEKLSLIGVGPNGISLDKSGAASVALMRDRLELVVDPSKLQVGQYSGRVVARFQNVAAPVEVPMTVQVRMGVVWPLLAIFAGVLMGQLARIMREFGDRQATMRLQFNRLLARLRSLPPEAQTALSHLQTTADRAIDQAAPDAAAADLTNFEAGCQILEKLEVYRLHRSFRLENKGRDTKIINAIELSDINVARSELNQLLADLVALPNVQAEAVPQGVGEGIGAAQGNIAASAQWMQATAICAWNLFIEYLARPLLNVVLLIMLVLVGLSTLYVDGSPTFGSRPLVDLFALFAWGLSADVASRTLANVRGK